MAPKIDQKIDRGATREGPCADHVSKFVSGGFCNDFKWIFDGFLIDFWMIVGSFLVEFWMGLVDCLQVFSLIFEASPYEFSIEF